MVIGDTDSLILDATGLTTVDPQEDGTTGITSKPGFIKYFNRFLSLQTCLFWKFWIYITFYFTTFSKSACFYCTDGFIWFILFKKSRFFD